jgi:hypothetical protein
LNLGQLATAIRFLSIRRVPSRWMPRLNGGGILGQSLKKGNARVGQSKNRVHGSFCGSSDGPKSSSKNPGILW